MSVRGAQHLAKPVPQKTTEFSAGISPFQFVACALCLGLHLFPSSPPRSPADFLLSLLHIPFFHLKLGCLCLAQNFCLDWCKQPDIGLPKPDLILFLQLSPEKAAERGNFGNERYENSSFQQKVLQSFYHLMRDKTLNWKVRK